MKIEKVIPALIRASFENDIKTIESLSLTLLRLYKKIDSNVSDEIAKILSFKNIGASGYRSIGINPSPLDENNNFALAKLTEPLKLDDPIFSPEVRDVLNEFIEERNKKEELLKFGIHPSNSILFFGEPGVGKTYSTNWLASQLNLPLITLDLSSTISSYLGKTGQNIKQVLEYAKSFPSILFLDEFDAIAKKRDDSSDIGELKRIVNVLLKELEEWPLNNIIVAATNHPEMLDKAIWRRFNKHIEMKNLGQELTLKILHKELDIIDNFSNHHCELISVFFENRSPADIVKVSNEIKRRYILEEKKSDISSLIIPVIKKYNQFTEKIDQKNLAVKLRKALPTLTVAEISELTFISPPTLYRIFKGGKNE